MSKPKNKRCLFDSLHLPELSQVDPDFDLEACSPHEPAQFEAWNDALKPSSRRKFPSGGATSGATASDYFAFFPQLSRRPTARLKTGFSAV